MTRPCARRAVAASPADPRIAQALTPYMARGRRHRRRRRHRRSGARGGVAASRSGAAAAPDGGGRRTVLRKAPASRARRRGVDVRPAGAMPTSMCTTTCRTWATPIRPSWRRFKRRLRSSPPTPATCMAIFWSTQNSSRRGCRAHLNACIFVNSGSEANDVAWRMAQMASGHRGGLVMEHAYHGITDAVAALTPSIGRPHDPRVVTHRAPARSPAA